MPELSKFSEEEWRGANLRQELRRHAHTLGVLAEKLEEAGDYSTDTALNFCKLIRLTSNFIASKVDSAPVDKLPYIFVILRKMGEYLRFAERSRIEQTPWSMVQATEKFLIKHTPKNCHFIIRPQWSYNYSIRGPFVEEIRAYLASLNQWMPKSEWEQIIGKLSKSQIYCISFPRVERMNVLMHVNWGHEVGHILAADWLAAHFNALWQPAENEIKQRITAHLGKGQSLGKKMLRPILDRYVSSYTKETMELTESGFKELICDFIGAHLFGPAALACLGEYSVRFKLDVSPIQCGNYPPWRMRLRKIAEVVADDLVEANLLGSNTDSGATILPYLQFLRQVDALGHKKDDIPVLEEDIRTREAYALINQHWPSVCKEVLKLLPKASATQYRLKKGLGVVHELVLRLQQGIPPNETGRWPDNTPASLPDIWNAAWAYRCFCLGQDEKWGTHHNLDDLFRLVLKGIESSFVHTKFGPKLKRIANHEHVKQDKN